MLDDIYMCVLFRTTNDTKIKSFEICLNDFSFILYAFQDCAKLDPCCDPSTCLLKYWAQCRSGACCHNCTVSSNSMMVYLLTPSIWIDRPE